MRKLITVICVAAALWSGYWVYGSGRASQSVKDWFQTRVQNGWRAGYKDLRTRGYPNRFDTTINALDLGDPVSGLVWRAPFFQIFRLSYKPDHAILIFPDTQIIGPADTPVTVTSAKMQASAVFEPDRDLGLLRANFVAEGMTLTPVAGGATGLDNLLLALRRTPASDLTYDLGIDARGLVLSSEALARFDPASALPRALIRVKLDATLSFDTPMDAKAFDKAHPVVTAVELRAFQADWGQTRLAASGRLTFDAAGAPSGSIELTLDNGRDLIGVIRTLDWITEPSASILETGLDSLPGVTTTTNSVVVPLTVRQGAVTLGPIFLGQLPRWILR